MAEDAEVVAAVDVVEAEPAKADAPDAEAKGESNAEQSEQKVPEVPQGIMDIDESDVEEMSVENTYEIDLAEELEMEDESPAPEDPERLPKEGDPYPPLYKQETSDVSGARAKATAKKLSKIEQEATSALATGDVAGAVKKYTEAMQTGGVTALFLATRGLLLLKLRRPCAAVRDCTAAIKLNSLIGKAYRVRGIAHRRLGNWKKAHRDLAEAQRLNFDTGTAEMQRFVAEKLGIKDSSSKKRGAEVLGEPAGTEKRRAQPYGSAAESSPPVQAAPPLQRPEPPKVPVPPTRSSATDLVANAMVRLQGLQNAPWLNGKRGVVQRQDPHPTRRGRWEVEVRLDGGKLEVKSLKVDNIIAINAADKAALRLWKQQEREHLLERQRIEEAMKKLAADKEPAPKSAEDTAAPAAAPEGEEAKQAAAEDTAPTDDAVASAPAAAESQVSEETKVPDTPEEALAARLKAMDGVEEKTRALMQRLPVDKATDLLDKAQKMSQDISMNQYLSNQAKLALDIDSSEDEQGG
mmetsp:Transcript_63840/g.152264  ORF Transcript_63840/g.152264 Transcript_63840/m.152264 type:complete len:522 (-) Transcript_63840:46-1611(-)